jgi:hypothetical protein
MVMGRTPMVFSPYGVRYGPSFRALAQRAIKVEI